MASILTTLSLRDWLRPLSRARWQYSPKTLPPRSMHLPEALGREKLRDALSERLDLAKAFRIGGEPRLFPS